MIACMDAKKLAERLLLGYCVPIGRHVYKAVPYTEDTLELPCEQCRVKCSGDDDELDVCVLLDILSDRNYYLERIDGNDANSSVATYSSE